MMALQAVALLSSLLVLANAQIPSFGWCPDYLAQADFDMERYLGKWYETERYFSVLEAGTRCVATNYFKAADGRLLVDNEITNRVTGIKRVLKGEIRKLTKGAEPLLSVKYISLPYPVETSYKILETDYDTYSVLHSCSNVGPINSQNVWVMTRERIAPGPVLQKVYGVLDRYKISRTFFVKTDQADCAVMEEGNQAVEEGNDAVDPVKTRTAGADSEGHKGPDAEKHKEAAVAPVAEAVHGEHHDAQAVAHHHHHAVKHGEPIGHHYTDKYGGAAQDAAPVTHHHADKHGAAQASEPVPAHAPNVAADHHAPAHAPDQIPHVAEHAPGHAEDHSAAHVSNHAPAHVAAHHAPVHIPEHVPAHVSAGH